MTQEQRQLMECLRAYLENTPLSRALPLDGAQWRGLYDLAVAHKMTAVVYQALGRVPEFCGGDPQLRALWRQDAISQVAVQAMKSRGLIRIAEALNGAGIPYAVVKGIACRQLYGQPDLRPSGDEDILIRPEDRQRCGSLFESLELRPVQELGEDVVSHWVDQADSLHIELHQALLPPEWEMAAALNPYFSQHMMTGTVLEAEGIRIKTLDHTAHFVFLVAHALKHFIAGGFGIRSMGDILKFAQVHAPEIDRDQAKQLLIGMRGWTFFRQLLAIGEAWLGMDPEKLGWPRTEEADYEPLLLDMLEAGVYGQSSLDRKHSAGMLVQQAEGKKKASFRTAVFPPADRLSGRYPVLKEKPGLLPLIWMVRIGRYAAEVCRGKRGESSPGGAVALSRQRQALMERYGVFPGEKKK